MEIICNTSQNISEKYNNWLKYSRPEAHPTHNIRGLKCIYVLTLKYVICKDVRYMIVFISSVLDWIKEGYKLPKIVLTPKLGYMCVTYITP